MIDATAAVLVDRARHKVKNDKDFFMMFLPLVNEKVNVSHRF